MEHNKEKYLIDPDYVANNKARRVREEKDKEVNKLSTENLSSAIIQVFDEELNIRQKQLEEVEEKIFKAQKLLHLVRYVLITSYYKKSNLEISPDEEVVTPGFDKQNRIHPAVKKLLGSNPTLDIFCAGKGKRRLTSRNCDKEGSSSQITDSKRAKLDIKIDVSSNVPTNSEESIPKNRKKYRHRLVIGNVSKWVPSLEDNTTHKWMMYVRGDKDSPNVSHIIEKVIFYLHPSYKPHDIVEVRESPFHLSRRGWGEFPLRVQIFFKCPLNKPISIVHNLKLEKTFTGRQTLGNETIVDVYLHENMPKLETVTKLPEELPSSSWYDSSENSPNTLKHNDLEADFTPLEETVIKSEPVDYSDNIKLKLEEILTKSEPTDYSHSMQLKLEEILIKSDSTELILPISKSDSVFGDSDQVTTSIDLASTRSDSAYGCSDTASMSFEHDYCDVIEEQFVDNEIEVKENWFLNQFLLEHSYCVLSGTENRDANFEHRTTESNTASVNISGNIDSPLVFGLGDSYLKEKIINVHNVVPKNLALQKCRPSTRTHLVNGYADSKIKSLSNYVITLPQNRFKNIGEALPFLLKRFKLWNKKSENQAFKSLYPYIATSQEEFEKWPFGKRLNSEWNRAREIKKILAVTFPSLKKWNTRACFMYARSHKYNSSICTSSSFLKNGSYERTLLDECFMHSAENAIKVDKQSQELDINVDIESDEILQKPLKSQKSTYIDITDVSLKNQFAFIKEASLDSGVIMRSEEISNGVIMNVAERIILEAVKCFAEGLIRRANHHLECKSDYRDGQSEVTTKEIQIALQERSEFQSIQMFQKKKREIEYFT